MTNMEKIREVRERSNVSLKLCKKAVDEAGNVEDALTLLITWGTIRAAKLAAKEASEGRVHSFIHHDGSKGCMVEVNCQTDFGSRSQVFIDFCEAITMHAMFTNPDYLNSNDIPKSVIDKQKLIFTAQIPEKAPEDKKPHIVNNKLKKWFSEVCLIDQKCVVPDEDGKSVGTVEQLRSALVSKMNENIVIKRFIVWGIN